jgi:hypothetical protein
MGLHAAAMQLRMGQLQGGAPGAERIAAARAFMRAVGLVNAPAWEGFLAPGFARLIDS